MAEIINSSQMISGKVIYLITLKVSKERNHHLLKKKIQKDEKEQKKSSWRRKSARFWLDSSTEGDSWSPQEGAQREGKRVRVLLQGLKYAPQLVWKEVNDIDENLLWISFYLHQYFLQQMLFFLALNDSKSCAFVTIPWILVSLNIFKSPLHLFLHNASLDLLLIKKKSSSATFVHLALDFSKTSLTSDLYFSFHLLSFWICSLIVLIYSLHIF